MFLDHLEASSTTREEILILRGDKIPSEFGLHLNVERYRELIV